MPSPTENSPDSSESIASSLELEYQILLARDLGYIARAHERDLKRELGEIRGMLMGLRRRLAQD